MPLSINKKVLSQSQIGLWEISEDEKFFQDKLALTSTEKKLVQSMKGRKKLEWLSSRHLIHIMSEREYRAEIHKDEHGKPYIHDSDHFISFSHSHGLAAAIASKSVVGIDVQLIVPKITRIAHKFVNGKEEEFIAYNEEQRIELLHIIWGAKESLYKAYGIRSLDFKKNMEVSNLIWDGHSSHFNGSIKKSDYNKQFNLSASKINNHILVYAEQI